MNAADMQSVVTGNSAMRDETEQEREEMERTLDTLRDELARVKMLNQDLEKALNEHLDGLESLEQENKQLREEGTLALEDLQALQTERDDLLASIEAKDADFTELRSQAVDEIDKLQDELEQKDADFEALRTEFKDVTDTAVKLEDELAASRRNEASIESQIVELEREIEGLDEKIQEINAKNERLEVQLENSQNETAFLREEQEGDKIKIGELEAALVASETKIEDMLAQIKEEKRQREMLDSQEKAGIQKLLDDINSDNANAKDEIRKLKKRLSDKEREAETWKERFDTLETDLREALGDMNGTRSTILKDVTKLQRDLEHTLSALEISRQDLAETESLLRTRESLLESSSLENKKLSDLIDKEKAARKSDRAAWELMQRSQQSLTRTIQQSDSRVSEIETARQSDRRKHAGLEKKLREQLNERNSLLLNLWTNLSSLCGPEFNKKHALLTTPGGSSTDALEKHFSTFARDVSAAIKAIESMFGSFKSQIRELEKKMWKEVQGLERALELRTKRVDHVEKMMATISTSRTVEAQQQTAVRATSSRGSHRDENYYAKLKSENKLLKQEVHVLRREAGGAVPDRGSSQRGRDREKTLRHFTGSIAQDAAQSPQHVALDPTVTVPSLPPSEYISRNTSPTNSGSPTRRASHHAGSYHGRQSSADVLHAGLVPPQYGQSGSSSEQRWVHRLKELERRLKAEREARLIDRSGARKRIEESEAERERLKQRLDHELEMRASLETDMGETISEKANIAE
jgi:predicted  nucleic acid-binding Zn-ribbon protein